MKKQFITTVTSLFLILFFMNILSAWNYQPSRYDMFSSSRTMYYNALTTTPQSTGRPDNPLWCASYIVDAFGATMGVWSNPVAVTITGIVDVTGSTITVYEIINTVATDITHIGGQAITVVYPGLLATIPMHPSGTEFASYANETGLQHNAVVIAGISSDSPGTGEALTPSAKQLNSGDTALVIYSYLSDEAGNQISRSFPMPVSGVVQIADEAGTIIGGATAPVAVTKSSMGTNATSGDFDRVAIVAVPTEGIPINFRTQERFIETMYREHVEIENGNGYQVFHIDGDIDTGYGFIVAVYVQNGVTLHARAELACENAFTWKFYKDAVIGAKGTSITPYDRNMITENTSQSSWYYDPDTPTAGTAIDGGYVPATSNQSGNSADATNEFDLEANRVYYWQLVPIADNKHGSIRVFFYEGSLQ